MSSITSPAGLDTFVRSATGLVREMRPRQAVAYNILAMVLLQNSIFMFAQAPYSFPGGTVWLAIALAGILGIGHIVTYALLSALMPRAGGDYVYQSRALHPGIGFVLIVTGFALWFSWWMAYYSWAMINLAIAPLLASLGYQLSSPSLVSAASHVATPTGTVITSLVFVALAWWVTSRGMRRYVRVQWIFLAGTAVAAITLVLVLALTGHATFMGRFNAFMHSTTGQSGFYNQVIHTAHQEGFSQSSGIDWSHTLGIMSLVWVSTAWAMYSALIGGEIRRAGKAKEQLYMMVTPYIVGTVFLVVLALLLDHTMGHAFLGSIGYLIFNGSPLIGKFTSTPYFWLLGGVTSGSSVVVILLYIGLLVAVFQYLIMTAIGATRIVLAATFDRLLPERLATVNVKTHAPSAAIAVFFLCSFVWVFVYNYTTVTPYTASAELVSLLAFMGTCLAAVVLPYRRRELYAASELARWNVRGVPVMTLAGLAGFTFNLYLTYLYLSQDALFANAATGLIVVFGIYAVVLAYYVLRTFYLRGRGLSAKVAFSEIPPE